MNSFLDKILTKSKFPEIGKVNLELRKLGLLRIIFGIIAFVRFYQIVDSYYLFNNELPFLFLFTLGLIILFTVGFLTPIVNVLLILFSVLFDHSVGTRTLGTTIFVEGLFLFLLTNSGNYYSLDRLMYEAKNSLNRTLSFIYSFVGTPSKESIRRAYFIVFLMYGISSFAALALHLKDYYWINGLTTKCLLSSAYLSNYYEFFRILEDLSPTAISLFSISGGIFQSIFQFLMIPLLFVLWGRYFVFFWGINFFLISLFVLNLSYLPHVELIIWLAIFLPINVRSQRVDIFYDDYCSLCKKAMKSLKLMNFNGRYNFVPISNNNEAYSKYDLSEKKVKSYMAGIYKGKVYVGFDLYMILIRINPVLWVLFPLFILGKYTKLGYLIYNYSAENRYKLFDRCELSFGDEIAEKKDFIKSTFKSPLVNLFYSFYIVVLLLFILIYFPYIGGISYKTNLTQFFKVIKIDGRFFKLMGLERPDVFNRTDLSMGDKWMVLYREINDKKELVPIVGEQGDRLSYSGNNFFLFANHNSDFLYFGCTLGHCRALINIDDKKVYSFHKTGEGYTPLLKRLKYDYKKMNLEGEVRYHVSIYKNSSSVVEHWNNDQNRHNKNEISKFVVLFNGLKIDFID